MLLEAEDLAKSYTRGTETVEALAGVSMSVDRGELVVIMGPSGSGKSSLLHLVGGLDRPTRGTVKLDGRAIESLGDRELSQLRRRKLGFVFQFFNLLPTLTAEENVSLPRLLDGAPYQKTAERARELLSWVGLERRATHRPGQLSGGEMQRVAIARALVAEPLLLLADEPTGNLDSSTGKSVLELFARLVEERKQSLVMVTHDARAAAYAHRVIALRDGRVESERPRDKVVGG